MELPVHVLQESIIYVLCHGWNSTGYNVNPFCKRQILNYSKLKESADDNFKLGENDRKLYTWVENIVGKGEIARYEQFLLFPQCFQKTYTADT